MPPPPTPPTAPPARSGRAELPSGPEHRGGGILARGWIVRSVIVITLLLTMAMVSLIYVRWLTVQEPTATIVVAGDSSLDGAQVLLSGGPSGLVPATLNSGNDFSTPIHLQPGEYRLTVKLGDQTVLDTSVPADRLHSPIYDLPTQLIVTGDSSDDGADVTLVGPDGSISRQELEHQSDYSSKWWLQAATYHLTVIRNGITLYDNPALTVLPHRPVSIDLTQTNHGRG